MKKIDIEYIANLARIRLGKDEIKSFSSQLSDIISYVEKLKGVDTSASPPTTHPVAVTNVLREDVLKIALSADKALANAPDGKDGFFRVPKVIEEA